MESLLERLGTKIEVPDLHQPKQEEQPVELLQIKTQDSANITALFPHLQPIEVPPILIYPPVSTLPGEGEDTLLPRAEFLDSAPPIAEQAPAPPADEVLGIAPRGEDLVAEVEAEEPRDDQPIVSVLEEVISDEEVEVEALQPAREVDDEETPEDDGQPITPVIREDDDSTPEDLPPIPQPDGEAGDDIIFSPDELVSAQNLVDDGPILSKILAPEEEEEDGVDVLGDDYEAQGHEEEVGVKSIPKFESGDEEFSEEEEVGGRPAVVKPDPVKATPDRINLFKDPFVRDGLVSLPINAGEIYMNSIQDSGEYPQPTRIWPYFDIYDIGEGNTAISCFLCTSKTHGIRLYLSVAVGGDEWDYESLSFRRAYFDPADGEVKFKEIDIPKVKYTINSGPVEVNLLIKYPLEMVNDNDEHVYIFRGYSPDGKTTKLMSFDPDKETFSAWGPDHLTGDEGETMVVHDNCIHYIEKFEVEGPSSSATAGVVSNKFLLYGDPGTFMDEAVAPCYPEDGSHDGHKWSKNIINDGPGDSGIDILARNFKIRVEVTIFPPGPGPLATRAFYIKVYKGTVGAWLSYFTALPLSSDVTDGDVIENQRIGFDFFDSYRGEDNTIVFEFSSIDLGVECLSDTVFQQGRITSSWMPPNMTTPGSYTYTIENIKENGARTLASHWWGKRHMRMWRGTPESAKGSAYNSWDGNMEWVNEDDIYGYFSLSGEVEVLWPSYDVIFNPKKQNINKISSGAEVSVAKTLHWSAMPSVHFTEYDGDWFNPSDGYLPMTDLVNVEDKLFVIRKSNETADDALFDVSGNLSVPIQDFGEVITVKAPLACFDNSIFAVFIYNSENHNYDMDIYGSDGEGGISKIETIEGTSTLSSISRLGINVVVDEVGGELPGTIRGKIFVQGWYDLKAINPEVEDDRVQDRRTTESMFWMGMALLDNATLFFSEDNMVYIYHAEWEIDDEVKGLKTICGGAQVIFGDFKEEGAALKYRGIKENAWWWRSLVNLYTSSGAVKSEENIIPCGLKKSRFMTAVITKYGGEWLNINNRYQWLRLWSPWWRDEDGKAISYQSGQILEKST